MKKRLAWTHESQSTMAYFKAKDGVGWLTAAAHSPSMCVSWVFDQSINISSAATRTFLS